MLECRILLRSVQDNNVQSVNSVSKYGIKQGTMTSYGGFGRVIDLLVKFTRKGWGWVGAATTIYDHLPPEHKAQVDDMARGLWKYLLMKNKGDFSLVTKMRYGLY